MRLLNTSTWNMKEFMSDDDRPRYAILSHTWGEQEISWAQWDNRQAAPVSATVGGAKIVACCRQALADGFEWVWADTCCIDKSSSAELSEAINSMFRWYRDAEICYAYLSDVPSAPTASREAQDHIQKSRWFTRGWTLQELLAPKDLRFYSRDWKPLGTKAQFAEMISDMTKIGTRFLGGDNLHLASIAQKMSWAATRRTTRLEDQAYCLLGLFDINIPLLYGEGPKAFQRLQHTLLTTYPEDQSLFAWGNLVHGLVESVQMPLHVALDPKPIPWEPPEEGSTLHGILATSPDDFAESHNIVPCRTAAESFYHDPYFKAQFPSLAGNDIVRVQLLPYERNFVVKYWRDPPVAQLLRVDCRLLLCNYDGLPESIGCFAISIICLSAAKWSRIGSLVYLSGFEARHMSRFKRFREEPTADSLLASSVTSTFRHGDIVLRRVIHSPNAGVEPKDWQALTGMILSVFADARLVRAGGYLGEIFAVRYLFSDTPARGFAVLVERVSSSVPGRTCLKFGLVPSHYESTGPPIITEKRGGVKLAWYGFPLASAYYAPAVRVRESEHLDRTEYSWMAEQKPFPKVFASVEKFPLRAGGDVDVVDIIIGPSHGETGKVEA